ncbi:MAG: tyrosine-type recombinase/integrase, partial [Lachnospiraceae bacterium]|nr:tyrosine-type recombinase/integrase [Lachnospiraceae bacterium]
MDESLKRQIHEECRIRNRSEGTCKQYTFHIGKFLDWIGDKPLNELTLYDAREYIIKKRNDGVKPGAIQSMLNKVGAEAGVKVHPHVLRHSFATHLIEDDTKREYVQAMLGHRSPNSTAVYINVSNKSIMGVTSPLDKKTKKLL